MGLLEQSRGREKYAKKYQKDYFTEWSGCTITKINLCKTNIEFRKAITVTNKSIIWAI